MNKSAHSDAKFQMLQMYEKMNYKNKFSKTIISEMIQIGILVTLLISQNMKNIPTFERPQ